MANTPNEELDVTVRAFTVRVRPIAVPRSRRRAKQPPRRRYPQEALVWDPETETAPPQRLTFGFWRLYRDRTDGDAGTTCIEEGIFYADELPERNPAGFAALRAYVETHAGEVAAGFPTRLAFLSAAEWLEEHFFHYGYRHRDRCEVVGYNVVFDLGRLAKHWRPAQREYAGGWSLGFWGRFDERGKWHDRRFHPRLRMRAIDPRRTLFKWGSLKRQDSDGKSAASNIVDLHQVVFTLTDKSLALEGERGACAQFGDPYVKDEVDYDVIDQRLIEYARDDVRHTATLYRSVKRELRRHVGIRLEAAHLFSPATVGVRYLEAMGVRRPLEKFTAIPTRNLGWKQPGPSAPKRRRRA